MKKGKDGVLGVVFTRAVSTAISRRAHQLAMDYEERIREVLVRSTVNGLLDRESIEDWIPSEDEHADAMPFSDDDGG